MPIAPKPISDRRVAFGRLGIVFTVLAWLGYFSYWLVSEFFNGKPVNSRSKFEAFIYLFIVSLLTLSNLGYLTSRLGFFYRARAHRRANRASIDGLFDRAMPTLTAILPSLKEDSRVIRNALLSVALQEYPYKRIVLLIDDPPAPKSRRDQAMLEAARALPHQIEELFAEPSLRFASALEVFELKADGEAAGTDQSMAELAEHYRYAALWLRDLADRHEIVDHSDAFLVNEVLIRLADDLALTGRALDTARAEGAVVEQVRLVHLYRRLAWIFRAQVSSFERKRYVSLSHEANKAMNLNSYLGLMGGSFREVDTVSGRILVHAAPGASDLHVPNPDYVLTLDADSMLMPEYCLRLVHLLEQSEHDNVAIAQTPYSAFPGSATRLERIAGATTDLQHIVHQGLTYYGATFWVGANAIIRKKALDDIVQISYLGDWEVHRYIQDRTVIEDTDSTIDLGIHGWGLLNMPERLSYSATPPDYGSLCIQRRRWSNGGLLILPKLRRLIRSRRRAGERTRLSELFLRTNYMVSVCWSAIGLLVMFAFPFNAALISPLLALVALPYFLAMASDLKYCGYKYLDVVRMYGFNLILLPVNLAGTGSSLVQALTAEKSRFGRTPKVRQRTVVPFAFVVAPYALVALAGYTFYYGYVRMRWENMAFAGVNALLALYAIVAFIGIRHSIVDLWVHFKSLLYKPLPREKRVKRPNRGTGTQSAPPEVALDWHSVLQIGIADPSHWPVSDTSKLIASSEGRPAAYNGKHSAGRESQRPGATDSSKESFLGEFRTVFQPIVNLGSREIVGYEALTRFADGSPPERRLMQAVLDGWGAQLELALARSAIVSAEVLPKAAWVGLNVSSRLLLTNSEFRRTLEHSRRRVVLELKEPGTIDADTSVQQLAVDLPSNVSLAIDNAGLGHRSLALVHKLRPRLVKLDRSVIWDVSADAARQAQLVAMVRVATEVGCCVVAVGVHSKGDSDVLRDLGIPLAQGYSLGVPREYDLSESPPASFSLVGTESEGMAK